MVQGIQHDAGEFGPGVVDIVCLYRQHQELGFHQTFVALLQLAAKHLGVQLPQIVKIVTLSRNLNAFHKILPVHMVARQGDFHADGTVMGIVHITEGFKDCGLVVGLGKLIILIRKLNAPGPGGIIQLAQTVRAHLPES